MQNGTNHCTMALIGHQRIEDAMRKSEEVRQTMTNASVNLASIPSLVVEIKAANKSNTYLLLLVAFVLVVNAALVANISFRASGFGATAEIGSKQ